MCQRCYSHTCQIKCGRHNVSLDPQLRPHRAISIAEWQRTYIYFVTHGSKKRFSRSVYVHDDYREQFLLPRHHCSRGLPRFSCRGGTAKSFREITKATVRNEKPSAFTEKETRFASARRRRVASRDNARDSGLGSAGLSSRIVSWEPSDLLVATIR